jgi:hypothetical protein
MKSRTPCEPNDTWISPNYRVSDWRRAEADSDWQAMTQIFCDRINGRFLKPIELIESDREIGQFAGFSIMALDCLLIETLHQFYLGKDETPKDHKRQFWLFFKESNNFKQHFTRKIAETFYSHVRCGLLHQAQTKGKTLIQVNKEKMIELAIPDNPRQGLIVDRKKFHSALKQEFTEYIAKLKRGSEADINLRHNFKAKMGLICGSGNAVPDISPSHRVSPA